MVEKTNYQIFTDASFDAKTKLATYSIIIIKNNKILKAFAKKSKIEINKSTEIEVFAIYQAINIIASNYLNKDEFQTFFINTDCVDAYKFFENKNIKIFENNKEIKEEIRKKYKQVYLKLSNKICEFSINWIPRKSNKIAHRYTYNMFKKIKKSEEFKASSEKVTMSKKAFYEILTRLNKNECQIIIHLLSILTQDNVVMTTQSDIAETLNKSNSMVNRTFKKMEQLSILKRVKNGKYVLLK